MSSWLLPRHTAAAKQVYAGAMDVLDALAAKLRASPGPYLLGAQPCSADAALFGHVAFYLHSPVAAPVLKSKVRHAACSIGPPPLPLLSARSCGAPKPVTALRACLV